MKISLRIFLGFAVILAAGFVFLISWIMTDVNVQPKKAMEESMLDMAHILASFLEQEMQEGELDVAKLERVMDGARKRRFTARIYELKKKRIALDVYVTDRWGRVLYDSNSGKLEGQDLGRHNDVYKTLKGKYGARTSRGDRKNPVTSVAYVAAPIRYQGRIVGVCSVSKSWKSINTFIEGTRGKISVIGFAGFAAALLVSFFIAYWITRPIRKLTFYADSVKEGKRSTLPELGRQGEIKELGESFEKMRESLEGRKYIEKYVQTLTHQLKGPLSAIRGAAELLEEDIPAADREKFISNINIESKRIQRIVDRMLELASLEQQRELRNVEVIDLSAMVRDIVDGLTLAMERKEIKLSLKIGEGNRFKGERFLIHQAIFNLLQNAVDFTPSGGTISVEIKEHFGRLFLMIRDSGDGIPEYALEKIFEKFYSLQRPDTGQKSSGLGLSLVKEVADLHKGEITIGNHKDGGVAATLKLPGAVSRKS